VRTGVACLPSVGLAGIFLLASGAFARGAEVLAPLPVEGRAVREISRSLQHAPPLLRRPARRVHGLRSEAGRARSRSALPGAQPHRSDRLRARLRRVGGGHGGRRSEEPDGGEGVELVPALVARRRAPGVLLRPRRDRPALALVAGRGRIAPALRSHRPTLGRVRDGVDPDGRSVVLPVAPEA
jgi:hypothetical protein